MTQKIDLTKLNKEEMVDTIDMLVYENYKWNRQQFPRWTSEQWQKVFGWNVFPMETKYQRELKK
ncbi:MAG: hypothetical protein WC479_09215 [Candidatus Izemoplasmatales bacterium]